MSDGPDYRLNRRNLLVAMSTVGAAGALTGRGAAAYLTDREILADNSMTAGSVTLALDGADVQQTSLGFTLSDYGFDNRDVERLCIGLGDESNPAWVWLHACPVASLVAEQLDARLTVDGQTRIVGSLANLLSELEGGTLLSEIAGAGGSPEPTDPGADGTVCLEIAVWVPEWLAKDPKAAKKLKRASPLTVTIETYAEQARHVPTPRRPVSVFPECSSDDLSRSLDTPAISNVSLCFDVPVDPDEITIRVLDPETGADVTGTVDEPHRVELTAPVPINDVVVAGGSPNRPEGRNRVFDADGATTIVVDTVNGTPLHGVPANFSQCACVGDGVKFDWVETGFDGGEARSCADRGGKDGEVDRPVDDGDDEGWKDEDGVRDDDEERNDTDDDRKDDDDDDSRGNGRGTPVTPTGQTANESTGGEFPSN